MWNKTQRHPAREMYHQPLSNSSDIQNKYKTKERQVEDFFKELKAADFDGPIDYDSIAEESVAPVLSEEWLKDNGFNLDLINGKSASVIKQKWTTKYKSANLEQRKKLIEIQKLLQEAGYWLPKDSKLAPVSMRPDWPAIVQGNSLMPAFDQRQSSSKISTGGLANPWAHTKC